jgi:putative peptidoglycan lipid II flippase
MSQTNAPSSIARSSAGMAAGTLVSRLLGLVRVLMQAAAIGLTGASADAWTNANTLPNIIYLLLAGGMLNAVLVPQLTKAMSQRDGGRDYSDRLLTLAAIGLVLVTVVFTAGSTLLVRFYAPSFHGDQLQLAFAFAIICMPQIFFYGLYTLLGQILNSRDRFAAFMWAPALANVVGIAGLAAFLALFPHEVGPADWTPGMIWLLGGSATLGIIVQALVLLYPVWRTGFRWRPRWGFRGVGLRTASRVAMWTFGIIAVSQIGIWVTSVVVNHASTSGGEGTAGRFAYEQASLLFVLPHSLITLSLVTALFPRMSRAAHARNLPALRTDLRHGLRLIGVAMIPVSLGMLLLGPSIASTLFFKNAASDTRALAYVMMAMVCGLVPYAVLTLTWRAFYAFEDAKTPFRLQIIITAVSVCGTLLALLLPPDRVAVGAGLSQAVGQLAACVVAVVWIRRRLEGLSLYLVVRTYVRLGIAALLGAGAAYLVHLGLAQVLSGRIGSLLTLVLGGGVLLLVYVVVAKRLRVTEVDELLGSITGKLRSLR